LGLAIADIDAQGRSIVVRLKGARDEHRVPVADDFWPIYEQYLQDERKGLDLHNAAWIGLRRGKGRPLTYSAFEASLRYAARKAGLRVHAHMLRHTMAQMVLESGGDLKVAQELLGHAHVSTTADVYMHVDHEALVRAVANVAARKASPSASASAGVLAPLSQYVFPYDARTIAELDHMTGGGSTAESLPVKERPR
jgi:site-specific recombinase XerD